MQATLSRTRFCRRSRNLSLADSYSLATSAGSESQNSHAVACACGRQSSAAGLNKLASKFRIIQGEDTLWHRRRIWEGMPFPRDHQAERLKVIERRKGRFLALDFLCKS